MSRYEKICEYIAQYTSNWTDFQWRQAINNGCIFYTYDDTKKLIQDLFPGYHKNFFTDINSEIREAEQRFLDDYICQ